MSISIQHLASLVRIRWAVLESMIHGFPKDIIVGKSAKFESSLESYANKELFDCQQVEVPASSAYQGILKILTELSFFFQCECSRWVHAESSLLAGALRYFQQNGNFNASTDQQNRNFNASTDQQNGNFTMYRFAGTIRWILIFRSDSRSCFELRQLRFTVLFFVVF
ncbi:unnamed protein product [Cuscuta campestris]|uniref:Uncharacterized protein n=1 Tax=Cuscuta campestris TaxID=132261 RepID=A0A484MN13_9ASTE|nr:unnamed protein product [Cuscuta campestris]